MNSVLDEIKKMLLLVVFVLVGCSYGSGENDQIKKDEEERQKVKAEYAQVEGTFEGNIRAGDKAIPMKLWIYTVESSMGKPTAGSKFKPLLKVKYRQLNALKPDVVMDADYSVQTGDLVANGESMTIRAQKKVIATSEGKQNGLVGQVVLNSSGVLGTFEIKKTSPQGFADPNLEEKEYRDRLNLAYAPLIGHYVGTLTSEELGGWSIAVAIDLKVSEQMQDKVVIPVLKGYFTRSDLPEMGDQALEVTYRTETDPQELVMNSNLVNGRYSLNILSQWIGNNTIEGKVYDSKGYLGRLRVSK